MRGVLINQDTTHPVLRQEYTFRRSDQSNARLGIERHRPAKQSSPVEKGGMHRIRIRLSQPDIGILFHP